MYHFIVNPNSRSGKGLSVWTLIQKELELRAVQYQAYMTKYVGHATSLSRQISSRAETDICLIAVGGDGTVQEVLTGITNIENVIFGFIPVGSGNDFGHGMMLPRDPVDALNVILKKEYIGHMDLPKIREGGHTSRFGVSAGIGFDAAVCQNAGISPLKKYLNKIRLGKLVYVFVAVKELFFTKPVSMKICLDGNRVFTYKKVYFAAIMNQKYEGGGFCFCPEAAPDDRILDIIIVEGISKLKLLFCLPTAFWGKHTHFRGIHILRGQRINISSELPRIIHKDGEAQYTENEFSVSLEKTPLKVILPVL